MKRMLTLLLTALLMLPLTACQTFMGGDISDLMSPPKLTGEQRAIEKALENTIGKGKFTLKYPMEGDYRSPVVLHNLDKDPEPEAIAVYRPAGDKAGAHVMILKKEKGSWRKIDDISGEGQEVDRLAFGDFDGNGSDELAIGWTLYTNTDLWLGVYSLSGSHYTKIFRSNFTEMTTLDMDGDGKTDILLLHLDAGQSGTDSGKSVASLVSYKNGRLTEISQTPLDSTVSRYAGLYDTKVDGEPAVLVDGYKGAHSMVTELLLWQNGALTDPLYDASTHTVTRTLRDVPISCAKMSGDGSTEIPVPVELPGYGNVADYNSKIWLVRWQEYADGNMKTVLQSITNSAAGYYFIYPDSWGKNVTVDKTQGSDDWIFRVWDTASQKMGSALFEIHAYPEDDWNTVRRTGGLTRLGENNGIVYAASVAGRSAGNAAYYMDIGTIRQNFKLTQ